MKMERGERKGEEREAVPLFLVVRKRREITKRGVASVREQEQSLHKLPAQFGKGGVWGEEGEGIERRNSDIHRGDGAR